MSSQKTTILKTFNKHFFEFVDEIIKLFPEKEDLKVAKTTFEVFRKMNVSCILKAWHFFVYMQYKREIDEGNTDFFYTKDYSADLKNLANANEIMRIIETLREPIKNMSDINKAHSVKYMQNLCKLSDIYSRL